VVAGSVVEEGCARLEKQDAKDGGALEQALEALRAAAPPDTPRDDRPWVLPWILAKNRGGAYLVVGDKESAAILAARVREVLS